MNDSWKIKSNDEIIATTGSIELTEIECPTNPIISFPFSESSTSSLDLGTSEPSPAWEFSHGSKQAVLNCEVFDNHRVFTFQNGIWNGCDKLEQGWHFPPLTFNDSVSDEITEFWIGGRLKDGQWINDQDEDIDKPVIYMIALQQNVT